jgi:hypothetical protein
LCGGPSGTGGPPCCTALLEHLPDRRDVDHVALDDLAQGVVECGRAVLVEKLEELGGEVAEIAAALGGALEECGGVLCGAM